MSEAFNSFIVDTREKPIVTMLEDIRTYMMERWALNRVKFNNLSDDAILPNIKKKIETISNYTNMWSIRQSDEYIFDVRHMDQLGDKYTVNLELRICSCRKWSLTGIPCCHAIAAMKDRNLQVENYIPFYYKKAQYAAVYKSIIYPVNGQNLWTRTPYPDIQPPPFKKMPGRPKKKRNLEQGEIDGETGRMKRKGFQPKCSRCNKIGHNKATCKVVPPSQTQPQATTQTQTQNPANATGSTRQKLNIRRVSAQPSEEHAQQTQHSQTQTKRPSAQTTTEINGPAPRKPSLTETTTQKAQKTTTRKASTEKTTSQKAQKTTTQKTAPPQKKSS